MTAVENNTKDRDDVGAASTLAAGTQLSIFDLPQPPDLTTAPSASEEAGWKLIHAYTQEDALADGVLLDARREPFAEVTDRYHSHTRLAVYLTGTLKHLLDEAIRRYAWMSLSGIWGDVLHMAAVYVKPLKPGDTDSFPVTIGPIDKEPETLFVAFDGFSLTFMCREDL